MKISQVNPRKIATLILMCIAAFILLILSSCVTEKKRLEICNTCPAKTITKDSVWEHLVHDTLSLPPIAGPIQYLENPCKELCDSMGRLKPFVRVEKKNGITNTIKTVGNSLAFSSDADSIIAYTSHKEKEAFHKKEESLINYVYCGLDHTTTFDGFCRWFFYIVGSFYVIKYIIKWIRAYYSGGTSFLK